MTTDGLYGPPVRVETTAERQQQRLAAEQLNATVSREEMESWLTCEDCEEQGASVKYEPMGDYTLCDECEATRGERAEQAGDAWAGGFAESH